MPTLQPQLKIGGYELAKLLGEGGMGQVWLAEDQAAGRQVALKFIRPHLLYDPGFRKRFSNEAKTLGKLEHDRIVSLYAVLDEGEHLALVLRFIDGKSLADKIDGQGALPLRFVLDCAKDILPALGFAHDRGIIHRDIKPPNILVDRGDRSFLMDFGIAVADFAERGTVTGLAVGTPHYMSPEQIRTPGELTIKKLGHRSDIYSFGVVLFEMLSGRVPFCHDSGVEDMFEIQRSHCSDPPPPLSEVNPQVPSAIAEVVMWCLEKDPNNRPQSCSDLLRELEAAFASGAVPSPVRTPTFVEGRKAAVQPKPAAQLVAIPTASRKIPQTAWYGLGAVVIAGGIGVTVWSSSGKVVAPEPHHNVLQPTNTQQENVTPGGSKDLARKQPLTKVPEHFVPPPNDKTAAVNEKLAAQKFKSGSDLFNEGKYCASLPDLNDAVGLHPTAEYRSKRENAETGCNTQ